jgi:hypothetical protein
VEPGTLLLIVGAILVAAVLAATAAERAGIPVLVAFLGLGSSSAAIPGADARTAGASAAADEPATRAWAAARREPVTT